MIIKNITNGTVHGRPSVSATVSWEDCGFGDRDVYFATDGPLAQDLSVNPNAFLLAGIVPAMRFGERRVLVEGSLCPQLREGLNVVVGQLRKWYGGGDHPIAIEAAGGFVPSPVPARCRTACCMSGGVDSLATFRRNRLDFPTSHPGAVRDLLFIHGFDMGGHQAWDENQQSFATAREGLSSFARELDAQLLTVYTNIRFLEEDAPGQYYTDLFVFQSHGACLAACAHAFSTRLTSLLVPSSHDVMSLAPFGSHPLLDPNYSSSSLAIRHDGLACSRMDKMRLLESWEEGLRVLRVCADPLRPAESMNCGRCEKCIRTMISLVVLKKLDRCPTFEANDVTPGDIDRLWLESPGAGASPFGYLCYGWYPIWQQLISPLEAMGRQDLADAVRRKIHEYEQLVVKVRWVGRIKRFDQRFLGGTLARARRVLRDGRARSSRTGPATNRSRQGEPS